MTPRWVAVLGAGPHGRQIAALGPWRRLFDDELPGYAPVVVGAREFPWVVGAMWPQVRRRIVGHVGLALGAQRLADSLDDGRVIFPGAQVGIETQLGDHVHVGFNAVIQHGCTVGDFVTVCAGAVLCGEVTVENDVFIGANATVIHGGLTIGAGATVGAGAVVTDDVPPGATVAGVPARLLHAGVR